ncbi:hypothetical protein [Fluviicola sp.]|uniref:hypothetical protein n=1 Tax=Fluviicola sp. TaxID=1917219 RepID=UPI0031E43870
MNPANTSSDNHILLYFGLTISLILIGIAVAMFVRRRMRSQLVKNAEVYQEIIEDILFRLMFGKLSMEESLKLFRALKQSNLLSKVTTQSIIFLHENYSGKQREILEDFFVLSDLTAYSFKKIRSRKAADIISGIRYLSTMNVREAFEFMKLELEHPNDDVKKEAFIGLVALQGMEGLSFFKLPVFPIDDITQERILNQLKNKRFTSFAGVHLLLYAENPSLILLGARITEQFQLHAYYEYILSFDKELQPRYAVPLEAIRERIGKETRH